ncbi:MAG: hypothetical protein ACTHY5_08740 [Oceanisphaera sp.]|uniref:hypothetical protein n=1 Tax=Oceanisphaera sp. TaxID=1929979 RepID=UPI003F9E6561
MKKFIIAPVAAVVMLGLSGYANAQEEGDVPTGVDIYKRVDIQTDIGKLGRTYMLGLVGVNQEASAIIDNAQQSTGQNNAAGTSENGKRAAQNYLHTNNSQLGDGSGDGAAGNIGINMSAGDNNVQANNAAMTVLGNSEATVVPTVPETEIPMDEESTPELQRFAASQEGDGAGVLSFLGEWIEVGASVDAEIGTDQLASGNVTINTGVTNNAHITDSLDNAAGNVGVNVASGNSNVQANNFAASYGVGASVAIATVDNKQVSMGNNTLNQPKLADEVQTLTSSMTLDAGTVDITGTMDQVEGVYPEIWLSDNNTGHNVGSNTYAGHLDFDDNNNNDDNGTFSFASDLEADLGDITVTSYNDVVVNSTVTAESLNDSILSNSLNNASGNVGVNVTSGSNNLQSNSLALSVGNF